MIELKHVSKTFDAGTAGGVDALKDVSLTIEDGVIYGIIGMSGAGKSTLVRCINQMSDSIMSSWENRNRSQDIMSQKQSDATLGYERIVDTETGNIYKIDNGFTDWYDGSRYKSITDDQYTDSVEAVIHWK